MQGPSAEAILEWLQHEIGFSQGAAASNLVSAEALRRLCRGNMLPVWKFLLERVRSDKTVDTVRRNIQVHGVAGNSSASIAAPAAKAEEVGPAVKEAGTGKPSRKRSESKGVTKARAERPAKEEIKQTIPAEDSREAALRDRDAAEAEVERLKNLMSRLQRDVKSRMLDLSREEGERQRVLDDKFNSRHKQVQIEAYDQRCEQTIRIFAEYRRRLHGFVDQARDAQRGKVRKDLESKPQEAVYATSIKGGHLTDDHILIETAQERNVRRACEVLASQLTEKIRTAFPAYEGRESEGDVRLEVANLGFDAEKEGIPEEVREAALSLLMNPQQLLRATANYTARVVSMITRETEKIDIRADAEKLRYKYENNRITEDLATEADENGSGKRLNSKAGLDMSNRRTNWRIRERQKAHVQQFMATEEALNHAAEAKALSAALIKSMHASEPPSDVEGGSRQLELEVWAKERELSGVKASVNTLTSEVQRLKKLCEERKEAEEALRRKWRKIEEFDARRLELESIYSALVRTNMAAAASWEQHAAAALEHSANTIIPICAMVEQKAIAARDLIENEATTFQKCPDNRLYMLPATPQGVVEAMGTGSVLAPEAVAAAERSADFVSARAGAGDPSAIPSVSRISAASQHSPGAETQDAGMVAVVDSLRFCLRPSSSPASLLDNLAKAIHRVQTLRDVVGSGRALLAAANNSRPEYERTAAACASTAKEQDMVAMNEWLPELKHAVQEAQRCLEDCKRVRGLVDEWWEQPAATAVDWITVDGQNAAAWLAHVKQLQTAFYEKQLL